MKISVGVSNRHCHLTKEDKDILFGSDYELTKKNDLNQIGEYACVETVSIKTDKDLINNVRIIGPLRDYTQVEISMSDAHKLGINPPVRDSGDLIDSESVEIVSNNSSIFKKNCCIIANRHIHLSSSFAEQNNFKDKQIVRVYIDTQKSGLLDDVHIKVSDNYTNELHLDIDDANAFLLKNEDQVEVLTK